MKSIKRIISLLLTALTLSNFCVVSAADDEQVVSLQFGEDGTVSDVYNNELTVYGSTSSRVVNSMAGDTVVLDSTGAVEIDGQNVVNSDEMTFEVWVSINSNEKSSARRLLAIRDMEEDTSMSEVLYTYTAASTTAVLKNRLGTKADSNIDADRWIEHQTEDIYQYADTWRHYSFTKKWNDDASKWITKTYVNGVLVNSSEEDGVKLSEDGCKLYLGSNTTSVSGLSKGLKCSYGAFNVYGKELDETRIKELYDSSKNRFKVPSNDMTVESVTPAEGDIDCDCGKITLKFSNFIDESTVNGNVVFSKENGDPVNGWSISVRDDIFVDITLPKLNHREKYKVTIKSGLKSQNDIPALDTEIKYTAKMAGMLIDEDFMGEEFVVGQKSPQISGMQFVSGHVNNTTTNIKVGITENGTKYLRVSPAEQKKSEAINIILSSVTEGCPVIEYKIRVHGDPKTEPRMGMLNQVNGTYLYTISDPLKIGANVVDVDEDGFSSFKNIIKKNSAGYYQYELHYTSGGEEKVEEVKFDFKMITSLAMYNVIQYYQTTGAVTPENYIDLAYVGFYVLNEPKAVESNLTAFDTENDEIVTVTFNDKMKEDTISEDTVKLISKENDSIIPWTFISYNADTKTASFKVDKTYLDYAARYDIDCFGTVTENGIKNAVSTVTTFETPALDVTISNPSFAKTEEGISFSVKAEAAREAEVKFIAVLYDLNNRAVQAKDAQISLTEAGRDEAEILMDYQNIEAGYTLKVIAVENDEGNLKPLTKMPLKYIVQ